MTITATSKISRTTNIAQRMFEERMLVITPKNSLLHRFNKVGTFIWQLLDSPKSLEDLCAAVKDHFSDIDDIQLEHDITVFLIKLSGKQLVTYENIG